MSISICMEQRNTCIHGTSLSCILLSLVSILGRKNGTLSTLFYLYYLGRTELLTYWITSIYIRYYCTNYWMHQLMLSWSLPSGSIMSSLLVDFTYFITLWLTDLCFIIGRNGTWSLIGYRTDRTYTCTTLPDLSTFSTTATAIRVHPEPTHHYV